MTESLDELYLTWLYSQIGSVKTRDKSKTYWSLARQLFTKEFVWLVPNDDNRVADGRDLRYEFVDACEIDVVDPDWMMLGCSFLELMIGISRRAAFEDDHEPYWWFWRIIDNLDLEQCTDRNYNKKQQLEIDAVLDGVIWRTYDPNGRGGLFPLERPKKDQREVELWYQLSAYLLEQGA